MNKKKIIKISGLCLLILISIIGYQWYQKQNKCENKKTILLFNWGEYIDPKIIEDYNKQSNQFIIKQSFFSSNELALNKIKAGNQYDIAILSDYAIQQLKEQKLLEKINKEKIKLPETSDQMKNIEELFTDKEAKINYFWGKIGLLYNKERIKDIKNWREYLENNEYKIAIYNNPFEGIFLGLKAKGGDISGTNKEDIDKAKEWLLTLKKNHKNLFFVTDQLLDNMKIQNEERYDIALTYSGDARYLMKENTNLEYYDFPDDGTNIWLDSLILPKGSNEEGAYDFINFLLEKKRIQQNTDFIEYNSPYKYNDTQQQNKKPILKFNDKDKKYKYNEICKKKINDAWDEVCAAPRSKDYYLLFLGLFILSSFISWKFIKKINY